jgi:hypothetical protein
VPHEASLLCLASGGTRGSRANDDRHVWVGEAEFAHGSGEEVEGAKHDVAQGSESLASHEC